jgi:hypothetical protein
MMNPRASCWSGSGPSGPSQPNGGGAEGGGRLSRRGPCPVARRSSIPGELEVDVGRLRRARRHLDNGTLMSPRSSASRSRISSRWYAGGLKPRRAGELDEAVLGRLP